MGHRKSKKGKKKKSDYSWYTTPVVPESKPTENKPPYWESPYNNSSKKKKHGTFTNYYKIQSVFDVADDVFGGRYWCVGENKTQE